MFQFCCGEDGYESKACLEGQLAPRDQQKALSMRVNCCIVGTLYPVAARKDSSHQALQTMLSILPFRYKLYQSIQIKLFIIRPKFFASNVILIHVQPQVINKPLLKPVIYRQSSPVIQHYLIHGLRLTKQVFYSEPFCLLRNTGPHQIIAKFWVHSEGITKYFFYLRINYRGLFLCKEKVILKDARIRKNLTLN